MNEITNSNSSLPDLVIRAALATFGVTVSQIQAELIRRYISLLVLWNQSVSLTGLSDTPEILMRHFGESMFAEKFLEDRHGRLADVGSGAGFPGLALKIACPDLQVRLIESNGKKAAFLNEVKRTLELSRVEVMRSRFEDIRVPPALADSIVVRALGNMRRFLLWSHQALTENGRILLWLGFDDAARLSRSKSWIWRPPIPLPESRRRVLLIGSPLRG